MNSSLVCVDASLALAWFIFEDHSDRAESLRREWSEEGVQMVAPALFHAEVASAIRKYVYFGRMVPDDGEEAFTLSEAIQIRTLDGPETRRKAWQLAGDFNLPVCYDMQYLAVAELHDCLLWTCDRRFVNTVRGKTDRVKWLGDYRA